MTIFSAETDLGQSLVSAKNIDDARASVNNNLRSYREELNWSPQIKSIKLATEEDLAWVKAMGGYVPKEEPCTK